MVLADKKFPLKNMNWYPFKYQVYIVETIKCMPILIFTWKQHMQ